MSPCLGNEHRLRILPMFLRTALNSLPKEGKGLEERPASVLSSLSYRKRLTLKDSIGGTGDQDSLLTTLSERAPSPERPPRRARPSTKEEPGQGQGRRSEEPDDRSSVFSGAGSRAGRGLEKRWGSDFDRASTVSAPVSRASSATRHGSGEDGARSCLSFSLSGSPSSRRSTSRLDSLSRTFSPSWSRASGLGRESPDSRLSLGQSCLDEWDDGASVALSEGHSQFSHPSLARSLSVPPQPRGLASSSATDEPLSSSVRPVSRHSYLDPDLEAAINEVLNYKPVPFQRSSLDPDSEEDDKKSSRSARSAQLDVPERGTGLQRSASAVDVSGSRSGRKSRSKHRSRRSSSSSSSSSSCSSEGSAEHKRRKKRRSRKSKKKSKSRRKKTETESESSSSSSASTVSGHSRSSVKKGPAAESEEAGQADRRSKKEEKKRKKEVDSLMMRYLYRPESD
ncbi:uncharacterized protein RHO17_020779 [Thomomys bottae]